MSDFAKERNNRQIILWGEDGQSRVDSARIVVLGSDCVVSEFLKNIVLHGFGNVTIIDDAKVSEEDLMSNFLIDSDDLGKSRAQSVAKLLRELNGDIQIEAVEKSPSDMTFLEQEPTPNFVVTCGNLKPSFLIELDNKCLAKNVLLGHVQSSGLFGIFYIDAGLHSIISSPNLDSSPFFELRPINPFPELKEYFGSFDFNNRDSPSFYHIPSPAIFYKVYSELSKKGKTKTSDIKKEILKLAGKKIPSFDEASQRTSAFTKVEKTGGVPENVLNVFKISDANPTNNDPFWRLVRATQRFYQKHQAIPHYGGIPDIETTTEIYIQLKKIYTERSAKDWEEIRKDLEEHNEGVDEVTFKSFLKNVYRIDAFQFPTFSESINNPVPLKSESDLLTLQSLFIAVRNLLESGRQEDYSEDYQNALVEEIKKVGGEHLKNEEDIVNYAKSYCVTKGHQIPSVSATIGAIFAEEVTKIIIHQGRPVYGSFVYNGVTCTGSPGAVKE